MEKNKSDLRIERKNKQLKNLADKLKKNLERRKSLKNTINNKFNDLVKINAFQY